MGDRELMITASFLWNSLLSPLRQATTIENFKRFAKTCMFKKAFGQNFCLFNLNIATLKYLIIFLNLIFLYKCCNF